MCDPLLREPGRTATPWPGSSPSRTRRLRGSRATASLRRTDDVWPTLLGDSGVRVVVHGAAPRATPPTGPGALADGDPVDDLDRDRLPPADPLRLPHRPRLSKLRLDLNPARAGLAAEAARAAVAASRHRVVDARRRGSRAAAPLAGPPTSPCAWSRRTRRSPPTVPQFAELRPGHLRAEAQRPLADPHRLRTLTGPVRPGSEARHRGHGLRHVARRRTRAPCCGAPPSRSRCASPTSPHRSVTLAGPTEVVAAPTVALRVDSLTLTRPGADLGRRVRRTVTRSGSRDARVRSTCPPGPRRLVLVDAAEHQPRLAGDPRTARCCRPSASTAGSRAGCSRPVPPARSTCGSRRPRLFTGLLVLGALLAGRLLAAVAPLRLAAPVARRDAARRCGPARSAGVDVVLVVVRGGLPHRLGRARRIVAVTWLVGAPVPGGRRLGVRRGAGAAGRHRRADLGTPQGAVLGRLLGPGAGRCWRSPPSAAALLAPVLVPGTIEVGLGRGGLAPHHPAARS